MRQDSNSEIRNLISMEEYLRKRQAQRQQDAKKGAVVSEEDASALRLAGILLV